MSELRAVSFTVQNVEGIAGPMTLRLGKPQPGQGALYVIEGRNGEGKSSLLHGIAALSAAAHDPSIIRDGAEKSVVKMTYWDSESNSAAEVSREIYQYAKGELVVKGDGPGVPTKKLESWIKDMMGVGCGQNPLEFLCANGKKPDAAKRKERLDYLMKVLDIGFSLTEISTSMAGAEAYLDKADRPKGNMDLPGINKLIRDLEAVRGPMTTRRDDAAAAAEKWRIALSGCETTKDWAAEEKRLEGQQADIRRDESEEVDLIQRQLRDTRQVLLSEQATALDAALAEWNRVLTLARSGDESIVLHAESEVETMIGPLSKLAKKSASIRNVEEVARKAVEKSRADHAASLEALAGELANAKNGVKEKIQTDYTRRMMEEEQQKAAALSTSRDIVDAAVKSLGSLKKSKLAMMPPTLDGLSVGDDDEFYINGRLFDKWNRAEQYIWAIKIGSIGTGELNLCLADEAEHLDDANLEKVRKGIVASGLTVIMARRSSGPLRSSPADSLEMAA